MKIKVVMAVTLNDGHSGIIKIDAELDAPILSSENGQSKIFLPVDAAWIECMGGEE
jgi:hypothetical protein